LLLLGVEVGCELGAALTLGRELGALLVLGARLTVGLDVGVTVGCDVGLAVGCVVDASSLSVKSASWHVPSRRRLLIFLTQFALQHCRSRKQCAPSGARLHLLALEVLISSTVTTDLHFLVKRNLAQLPLQHCESSTHVCPPSLLLLHSP
jgi:hypothetical protein